MERILNIKWNCVRFVCSQDLCAHFCRFGLFRIQATIYNAVRLFRCVFFCSAFFLAFEITKPLATMHMIHVYALVCMICVFFCVCFAALVFTSCILVQLRPSKRRQKNNNSNNMIRKYFSWNKNGKSERMNGG